MGVFREKAEVTDDGEEEVQEVRTIKYMKSIERMNFPELQRRGYILQLLRSGGSGVHFWRPPLFPGDRVGLNLRCKQNSSEVLDDPIWADSVKPIRGKWHCRRGRPFLGKSPKWVKYFL